MELLNEIFSQFNAVLWGPPLILLLLGTHLWMTVRTRGVQRWVFKGIKLSVTPDKTEGDISPFAALTTALASTIGTGNIIGVATAIGFRRAGRSAVDMADRVVRASPLSMRKV